MATLQSSPRFDTSTALRRNYAGICLWLALQFWRPIIYRDYDPFLLRQEFEEAVGQRISLSSHCSKCPCFCQRFSAKVNHARR